MNYEGKKNMGFGNICFCKGVSIWWFVVLKEK